MREISIEERGQPASMGRASWTIREALDWATRAFRSAGLESSRFEAEELLAYSQQIDRLSLYLRPGKVLEQEALVRFQELVRQRTLGTPSAYIVGQVDFYKTKLHVSPSVLIPRPETEELVDKIIIDFQENGFSGKEEISLLDLGTGSGAIAIALLKEWPKARAVAIDVSDDALKIARENAIANGVDGRITLLESDWTAAVSGPFDLVVSNPPYIPTSDLEALSREVIQHEPRIAVDGGVDGMRPIEQILNEAPRMLKPGCPIYLEIGYNQRGAVEGLLKRSADFDLWSVFQDLGGRDRIARAYRRGV